MMFNWFEGRVFIGMLRHSDFKVLCDGGWVSTDQELVEDLWVLGFTV
jgi:hypothetical protein